MAQFVHVAVISNIFHGEVLDENFLMFIASFAAFGIGLYKGIYLNQIEGFDEACGIIIFYQVGEFFQDTAINKSRNSIASLMNIKPDFANIVNDFDGNHSCNNGSTITSFPFANIVAVCNALV